MGTKLANWWAQRMGEHIDGIIDICLIAEEEKNAWKAAFQAYSLTIKVCISL